MHQKLVPDPFLILVFNYQKALQKFSLFFLSNPVPLNGQSYQKQKRVELVTSRSSDHETSSRKFLYQLSII